MSSHKYIYVNSMMNYLRCGCLDFLRAAREYVLRSTSKVWELTIFN